MKNKILLPLIAIIFLSSCANKFSLTKRKYNKGYHFASSKNHSSSGKENEQNLVIAKKTTIKNTILPVEENLTNTELKKTIVTEIQKNEIAVRLLDKNNKHYAKTTLVASASKQIESKLPAIKKITLAKNNNSKASKSNDSDVSLILLVILCLFPFINLIPVYIHDGKKVTTNFLITLILDIFLILGVIFALLVVLDVIDLK